MHKILHYRLERKLLTLFLPAALKHFHAPSPMQLCYLERVHFSHCFVWAVRNEKNNRIFNVSHSKDVSAWQSFQTKVFCPPCKLCPCCMLCHQHSVTEHSVTAMDKIRKSNFCLLTFHFYESYFISLQHNHASWWWYLKNLLSQIRKLRFLFTVWC